MIVTCSSIQEAEARLFAAGTEAEPLMERAGLGCALVIRQWRPRPGRAVLYAGRGNNGGDALVIGRHLRDWGWEVTARLAAAPEEMTDLARRKLAEFEAMPQGRPDPGFPGGLVLIDGLLGVGARGPLRDSVGRLAEELNARRLAGHALAFAVDIPSGVDGDSGEPYPGAVQADVSLAISAVKAGLVADRAIDHVGRLALVELPEIAAEIRDADRGTFVTGPSWVAERLPRRTFSCHKGQAGRVAVVAGSRGLSGAARLSGLGALRGGAGLVTLFVPESIYGIVAGSAPPEVMVRPWSDPAEVAAFPAEVIALGPGLGNELDPALARGLLALAIEDPRPLVIDADGLNLLSRERAWEGYRPAGPRLLTPHPGELARMLGGALPKDRERVEIARDFVARHPVTLLFKGARTVVAEAGRAAAFNSTGHPGMATGGIGDVVTGLCAALAAQGMNLFDAAAAGSWLAGRAAEIVLASGAASLESLAAGDVAEALGAAFEAARGGGA